MASPNSITDYRRLMWDRLDGIAYPGEHPFLFGHDDALNLFAGNYHDGRLHHAWLVTGPRGIGKATLALALSGHIFRNPEPHLAPENWQKPALDDPIGSQIGKGGHPNILHLSRPWDQKTKKFKGKLTVDEVRRTVSFFTTTAGADSWRICIVDTADDLNISAANALLKILEEPPARTVFFVLCHSPGRLLPTIRSRCRQLALKPLGNADMMSALEAIGAGVGGLSAHDQQILTGLSAGSVRRALVIQNLDGLDLHRKFSRILEVGGGRQPDWPLIHKLADDLARKNHDEQYRLLLEIAQDYIATSIKDGAQKMAVNAQGSKVNQPPAQTVLSRLAHMCDLWEKTDNSARLADSYNLDRKQVILSLFGSLTQMH